MDEKSADPISFSLFRMILTWAVERGNIFVWVWTILQWNLMARSISIDPLALHNIGVSEDHFVIRHDSTKSDKEGDKIHNKAVYCNPMDHVLCPGVSLGVWLALNQNTFRDNSERIFIRHGARLGSAVHRYCKQLLILMKAYWDCTNLHNKNVGTWLKEGECHTCGTRNYSPTTNCLNCKSGRLVSRQGF